jgi:hypothetical protein
MKDTRKLLKKSRRFRAAGLSTMLLTTLGGFFAYEMVIDWENFRTDINNFFVVQEETVKLNLMVAFPLLIGMVIFLFIARKRSREFFADKVSMSILIAIVVLYLVYSVIAVALASLAGAFAGAVIDEAIFTPLSKRYRLQYDEEHDIDLEYEKEKRRIIARKQAREDLNGSV